MQFSKTSYKTIHYGYLTTVLSGRLDAEDVVAAADEEEVGSADAVDVMVAGGGGDAGTVCITLMAWGCVLVGLYRWLPYCR